MSLRVLYLAHDLADPAIRRRVMMLRAGGAEVLLAGFRRDDNPLAAIAGLQPIELGRTADGQFRNRAAAVLKASLLARRLLSGLPRPDLILARNLEMLAVAQRLQGAFGAVVPIVYECLDIHRLMLREDPLGLALRALEGRFSRRASLLVTSSPAFVEKYFAPLSKVRLPVLLLENQVLDLSAAQAVPARIPRPPAAGEPWRIGWFGALRCAKSFRILADFTRALQGRVHVDLRGRPAQTVFADFDRLVAAEPYMTFHGPYRNPEDLEAIYGSVQFAWAIDFFEEGQNSSWLLPNRLYESCRHGAVPLALAATETGRHLAGRGLGLVVEEVVDAAGSTRPLQVLFETMTPDCYRGAVEALAGEPASAFTCGIADCQALVGRLAQVAAGDAGNRGVETGADLATRRDGPGPSANPQAAPSQARTRATLRSAPLPVPANPGSAQAPILANPGSAQAPILANKVDVHDG